MACRVLEKKKCTVSAELSLSLIHIFLAVVPGRIILRGYEFLTVLLGRLSFCTWIGGKPEVWQIVGYYLVLAAAVWIYRAGCLLYTSDIQILNIAELLLFVFMICTCIRIYRQKKQKGKISLKTLIMFLPHNPARHVLPAAVDRNHGKTRMDRT